MTAKRLLLVALVLTGCASGVDLDEPRRLLGREGDIRVDAQMFGEQINPGSLVTLTYEIQNFRATPIAFSDVVAASDFDPETRTITVTLGAEVPGTPPPRLEVIGAGEKKTFTAGADRRVEWENTGEQIHNVKGDGFFSRAMNPGERYSFRFRKADSYDYLCTLHPQMKGTIVVD